MADETGATPADTAPAETADDAKAQEILAEAVETGEKPADDKSRADGFKSEESKKAVLADLAKEREARKALEARFEKLGEAFGVQKPENGKTDVDQLTERLTKHEQDLAEEREARWRAEVAHAKGMTPEQAAELRGKTREDFEAHAERLKTLFPAASTPGTPKPDPTQGARGGGIDIDAQIAEAQKAGDFRKVISLQNQKLAEQATNQ